MAAFDIDTVLGWRGNTVRAGNGEKIGTVGDVFLDRETDRPAWIGVRTGWFGTRESYVPISQARVSGDEVHVPYGSEQVKTAPQIDPDVSLDAAEEDSLYRHYGVGEATAAGASTVGGGSAVGGVSTVEGASTVGGASTVESASTVKAAATAADASTTGAVPAGEGATTDASLREGEMVRSEEEVRLGHVERRPTERVRIKKVLVTDHVKQVVPVRREVVQLEHEPAPPGRIESSEALPEQP